MNTWEGNKEGVGWGGGRKGTAMQDKALANPSGIIWSEYSKWGRYSQAITLAS